LIEEHNATGEFFCYLGLYNAMETFLEWLGRFDEESRQEREAREREAAERDMRWGAYSDKMQDFRRHPEPPFGSPGWSDWARNAPENPKDDFRDSVEEEIRRLTGMSWNHGQIIDTMSGDPKKEADDDRVSELIEDSWEDGSSPQEAARMAVELMKSMGYLR